MKQNDNVVEYVSFGHEVYKNLFSGLLFKLKENEKNIKNGIDDPNNFPELETTEDGSLVFAIKNFNDENILRTANALNKALNKINDEVNINTFLKIYRLFAEFRWALSCRLKSDLNLHKDIVQNIDDEIINTNKGNEFYNENKIDEQPNDIYNYHKYSYETGEEIQTKDFYTENSDTTKLEIIKTNDNDNEDNHIELIDEQQNDKRDQINEIREKIRNMETETDIELSARLNEYKWSCWQIFLWLLFIFPGLIHEIWRRYKRNDLKTRAIDEMYKKLELECLGLPINFIIERQLAFLQANEVFFKNMILKSNDPKFLKQMEGKSINTFLRENSNLVNSVERYEFKESSNSIDIDDSGTIAYKKNIPTDSSGKKLAGGMKNTHRININGKNYFTKEGKLFLDSVNSETNEKDTEEYRGNFDEENWAKDEKTPLIDTASHGCIMKAFDNFLGLNVLVDTKLIVTPDGYDVFMKSANGKNAGDIFWDKKVFCTDEHHANFIKGQGNCQKKKQNNLNELAKNPLSSELQDAIMKINFLDYLCSNHDRHTTNLFVWKNGLAGIDNEFAFCTDTDWTKQAWALCIKEDLPNLIPYATQKLYDIAKSLIEYKNVDKLIDIYMIFAKTANEKNLLQGTKNIRTRAKELYDHFKWLEKNGRILKSVENFNSKTAQKITKKSLIFNRYKQDCLQKYGRVGTATGMGVLGYINTEIQKYQDHRQNKKNLPIILEEDENWEGDKYDKGDIF